MPSKREVEEYKLLSDRAVQEFKISLAARRLPRPDHLSKGAFDSLSPQLKSRLRQLTPKQKREVAIALDAGADPQLDLAEKKVVAKLLEAIDGDNGEESGFGGKLIRLLDQLWPGCCGDLTGEDEEAGETGFSPEEAMGDDEDDDDEEETKPERLDFKSAGAARKMSPEQAERRRRMLEGERPDEAQDTWASWRAGGGGAQDDPPKFPGMPRPGGKTVAQDSASDDYSRRFPETARIAADDNFGKQKLSVPRSPLNRMAFDARVAKRVNQELDDADDYAARFPETERIQIR